MTTLLMVRHGESTANLDKLFAGDYDVPLTELGHKQAECTAEFIVNNYHVDIVCSSDLRRAYATAEHTAHKLGLPICKEPGLREIRAGEWEGHPFYLMSTTHPQEYKAWVTDIGHARCPQGESTEELAKRVYETLCRIGDTYDGKTVLITTHATPIRATQWIMTGLPIAHMQNIPWVTNASVTELVYEKGVLTPVIISQDSHLQGLKTALPSNV